MIVLSEGIGWNVKWKMEIVEAESRRREAAGKKQEEQRLTTMNTK